MMEKNHTKFHHRLKKGFSILFPLLFLVLLSAQSVLAYEFSSVRETLDADMAKSRQAEATRRLALIYNVEQHDSVKSTYDLVKLKKELSHELLKSFQVVDPVIVNEILTTNHISYDQLSNNPALLKQFAGRSGSKQILFVNLKPKADSTLLADMKMVDSNLDLISRLQVEIKPDQTSSPSYHTASVVRESSDSDKTVLDSFVSDFVPKSFVAGQDDSWMYFAPTALIIPSVQSLEMLLWLKHLGEVDIRPVRLRYDAKFLEKLQFGLQMYAIVEKVNADSEVPNTSKDQGVHSLYASIKYQIGDDFSLPFSLALGLKRRLFFDDDNTDFTNSSSNSINSKNDRYNQLTLQAMATGKIERLGLMYNFYLDSQTFSAGAKFLLASEIKLFLDNIIYYYDSPQIPADTAFGVQMYSTVGNVSLAYQMATEQIQLGLLFDF